MNDEPFRKLSLLTMMTPSWKWCCSFTIITRTFLRAHIQTHLKTCVLQWQYEISQQASKLTVTFKWKSYILQSWAWIQVLDKYIRQAAFGCGNCNLAHIMNQESNLYWFVLVLILYTSASFRWHFLSLDELQVNIACRDKSDKHKELSLSNERFQNRKS